VVTGIFVPPSAQKTLGQKWTFEQRSRNLPEGKSMLLGGRCAVVLGLVWLTVGPSPATAQSGGQQVCFGEYVLCDAAPCEAKKNYQDGDDIDCYCHKPGPGLNIANSVCDARQQSDLSTYSLRNINPHYGEPAQAWGCTADELLTNGKGWAFCLDAPCRQDESHSGGWTCSCKYQDPRKHATTMYTFGKPSGGSSACQSDCNTNWSGATWSELLTGHSALALMHSDHITLRFCEAAAP
jgi:hypothetical protein